MSIFQALAAGAAGASGATGDGATGEGEAAEPMPSEGFSIDYVTAKAGAMLQDFASLVPMILLGIAVFFLFYLVAKAVARFIRNRGAGDDGAGGNKYAAFARLAYIAILVAGFLVAITIAFPTMTPGRLFQVLGIGGVAIGFAFKDIFQNLLAGILILVRQPFKVGDEITSGNFTGTVESIETRATWIRSYDGKRIIIPNAQIYTEPVVLITAYDKLRTEYDFGIGYGDDIDRAREIALETVKGMDGVMSDPAPDVLVWELAGSSVNLRLRWWSDPHRGDVLVLRDKVLREVTRAYGEAGIDMPYPTQVILFHDQTEETDGDRTKQREGWPAGNNPPKPRRLNHVKVVEGNRGVDDAGTSEAAE